MWESVLAAHLVCMFPAWCSVAWDGSLSSFNTLSNFSFFAPCLLLSLPPSSPSSWYPFLLIGAASLAFHADTDRAPTHVLDIALGWVLYWHLFCFGGESVASRIVSRRFVVSASMVLRAAGLCLLFAFFEHVYTRQVEFYMSVGGGVYLLYAVGARMWREVPFLFVLHGSGTLLQGELAWKSESQMHYHAEHAHWHMAQSMVATLFVVRFAQHAEEGRREEERFISSKLAAAGYVSCMALLSWLRVEGELVAFLVLYLIAAAYAASRVSRRRRGGMVGNENA